MLKISRTRKVVEVRFLIKGGHKEAPLIEVVYDKGESDFLPVSKKYASSLRKVDLITLGTFGVEG